MLRGSNLPGGPSHKEVKDMFLKRGFAAKESKEYGTNETMTRNEPEEALGPRAVMHNYSPEEWKQKTGTEKGSKELRTTAEAKTGPCPVCKERHVYQRKLPWGSLQWQSDWLQECKTFQALSSPQRAKVIKEQGGCVACLSWAHVRARCNRVRRHLEGGPSMGCQEREGAEVCGQPHHRMLHGIKSAYVSAKR